MFIDFVQDKFLLFIALAIIVLMLAYSYIGDRFLGYEQVSPNDAIRLFNNDALMIDVRTEGEYKSGFIGDAMNLPTASFKSKIASLEKYKDKEIVVYCQSGMRSGGAASNLVKEGFTKVYNLRGGILAWRSAGLPVQMPESKKAKRKGKKNA